MEELEWLDEPDDAPDRVMGGVIEAGWDQVPSLDVESPTTEG